MRRVKLTLEHSLKTVGRFPRFELPSKLVAGIRRVDVVNPCRRYQDTGRLRGYAHVVFATKKARRKAITLDGKYLGDR